MTPEEEKRLQDRQEEVVSDDQEFFGRRRSWINQTFFLLLLSAGAIAGLFLYAQVVSILGYLGGLPKLLRMLGYLGLGALGVLTVWPIARLAVGYCSLRVNQRCRIDQLTKRAKNRAYAARDAQRVREWLTKYLGSFDPLAPEVAADLCSAGLSVTAIGAMAHARETLLRIDYPKPTSDWIEEFRTDFQSPLDQTANGQIRKHAVLAGVKAAIAPHPLLDTLAALYNSFTLIEKLCRLYHMRADFSGTLALLAGALFSGYIAGQLHEGAEELANEISSQTPDLASGLAARFTPKFTQGLGVGLMVRRLGKWTQKKIRPL